MAPSPPRSTTPPDGPRSVAIGDLNGDGKPDLAIANDGAANVSVLLNKGNGTFGQGRLRAGRFPRSVAIGDLNGDGKPDLAAANARPEHRLACSSTAATAPSRAKVDYPTGREPPLGRDRRPERRRQARPRHRERRREHASPCCSTGATAPSRPSSTTHRTPPCVGRDRRPERRRQARPGGRELRRPTPSPCS